MDNLENIDEVKRAKVAFLFYKHGPIDRIESHNEYFWLELTQHSESNPIFVPNQRISKTKFKSEMAPAQKAEIL